MNFVYSTSILLSEFLPRKVSLLHNSNIIVRSTEYARKKNHTNVNTISQYVYLLLRMQWCVPNFFFRNFVFINTGSSVKSVTAFEIQHLRFSVLSFSLRIVNLFYVYNMYNHSLNRDAEVSDSLTIMHSWIHGSLNRTWITDIFAAIWECIEISM